MAYSTRILTTFDLDTIPPRTMLNFVIDITEFEKYNDYGWEKFAELGSWSLEAQKCTDGQI